MTGISAQGCQAYDNGGSGIAVTGNAEDCAALGNGGWGVWVGGNVENTWATRNGSGLAGRSVSGCTARDNLGTGIQASGVATDCLAEENRGAGITGKDLLNCQVVRNGTGLSLQGTATRCTIAENAGTGVTGASVDSCVVLHNAGAGLSEPPRLTNSWILGNAGSGVWRPNRVESCAVMLNGGVAIEGRRGWPGAPLSAYSSISNSTIRANLGSGVRSSGLMTGCNIYENGGELGYDYEEQRPSTQLERVDLLRNYWGPVTTAEMDAHPWGGYHNMARIYDFVDDTSLCEAKYDDHLSTLVLSATPDLIPPAFLLAFQVGEADVIGVGVTTFTLYFSKSMDFSAPMSVTFGTAAPYTAHVVRPAGGTGWRDAYTWQGAFAVQSNTGDGLNRVRVVGARAAQGFEIPDDTSRVFRIDASGEPYANNGLVFGSSSTRIKLSWSENDKPATALGYNLYRSEIGAAGGVRQAAGVGDFVKINNALLTEPRFADTDVEAGAHYIYQVYIVDSGMNAQQWTSEKLAWTEESAARVEGWLEYR